MTHRALCIWASITCCLLPVAPGLGAPSQTKGRLTVTIQDFLLNPEAGTAQVRVVFSGPRARDVDTSAELVALSFVGRRLPAKSVSTTSLGGPATADLVPARSGLVIASYSFADVPSDARQPDFEFSFRERYLGERYEWPEAAVGERPKDLPAVEASGCQVQIRRLHWRGPGSLSTADGAVEAFVKRPSICFELAVRAVKSGVPLPLDDDLALVTADGSRLLRGAAAASSLQGRPPQRLTLAGFESDEGQPVRISWAPVLSRDTGTKFVFKGLRAKTEPR